jgi:hypothetical protein
MRVNPIMSSGKKRYTTPRLVDHGDVAELTRHGGSTFVDAPIGTPVNGNIANVAS